MISKIAVNAGGVVYEPTAEWRTPRADLAREFWLLCRAGSHCFALPMPHVIEIMRMLPIKSLVGAPPQVRGLCIIRGTPVPVIDAGLLFDEQGSSCERLVTVRPTNGRSRLRRERFWLSRKFGGKPWRNYHRS